jgi:glycogen debranching enzyme
VYDALLRWHDWWLSENIDEGGLCVYRHPFSSGLDDSPLWDEGMPVTAPDLNTYLCLQCESLARIAELIGDTHMVTLMRERADQFAALMIEQLWDESRGLFMALHNGQPVDVATLFNLLPLATGRLPEPMVLRLLERLTDPGEFWTAYPLATVSVRDDKFDPQQMWRGPSWVNINYLFIEALFRVGKPDLARRLRHDTLAMIQRHPDIYEYYNPLTGERPPKAAPIFGWTSAVFIDLALQATREAREGGSSVYAPPDVILPGDTA